VTILQKNSAVGQVVKVKIVSLTAFGALRDHTGIDGLIHIARFP
jgi:ribosomal protein S1